MHAETPKKKRPELALIVIALLAFLCLVATVMLCLPFIDLPRRVDAPVKAPTEEETWVPETTEAVTEETTVPTLPPELNPLGKFDFQYNRNNYLVLSHGESYPGIDVSAFQGDIDWQQVADTSMPG